MFGGFLGNFWWVCGILMIVGFAEVLVCLVYFGDF